MSILSWTLSYIFKSLGLAINRHFVLFRKSRQEPLDGVCQNPRQSYNILNPIPRRGNIQIRIETCKIQTMPPPHCPHTPLHSTVNLATISLHSLLPATLLVFEALSLSSPELRIDPRRMGGSNRACCVLVNNKGRHIAAPT